MPHGPQAGIAGQATRLAARAVLLAAVVAAVASPAVAGAASVAYVDNGEVWLSSLDGAQKARLATPVVNARRRDRELARRRAVRQRADRGGAQQAGPDVELLVVQDLGAGRDLDRRGPAQRPERLDRLRLSARLRHHRGRVAPRLRLLELERLLPDPRSRTGPTSGRRPTACSTPIDTGSQTHPSLFGSRDHLARGLLAPDDRQRPERGRRQPLHERLHARGSTPRRRARPRRRRRRGQRAPGGARVRGVERRHADGRQDRRPRDPGGRSGARVPRRRGLLPARGRHRTGRIARAGRRGDRVEGRRRREGRRQPHDRRPTPA